MEHKAVLKKKAALINNLRTTVNRMNIEAGEKSGMIADLEDLSQLTSKDNSIRRSVDALVKQHQLARDIQMLTDAFSTSSQTEDPT
jgi:trimethylamine:corrinoid methyltransferase-like protein